MPSAWAFATVKSNATLFAVLARKSARRVKHFDAQGLANIAWAFAIVLESDALLIILLPRKSDLLARMAWAFATVKSNAPLFAVFARTAVLAAHRALAT